MTKTQPYIEMLQSLIRFDTTSCNSNLELVTWVKTFVEKAGAVTLLDYDKTGQKANLFVTFPAHDGEAKKGGLVFSGHTDVVPIKDQSWSTDPFDITIKDGKIFGRGTSDMKGFLAVILAETVNIAERKLNIPLHFALSFDEEVGCLGVPLLIENMKKHGIEPRFCVVGEPTEMRIVNGHKGQVFYKVAVIGLESHSSLIDNGVNAIDYAVQLISFINQIGLRSRTEGPRNELFDPAFNSFHVGVIRGGTVNNIIPNHCEFQFEVRYLPGTDPTSQIDEIKAYAEQTLVPKMRERAPHCDITFEKTVEYPGLDMDENCELIKILQQLTGANHVSTVSFGAEAGHFQHAGIETIICGPGSIEQAHKTDEFITLDQLERGSVFVRQLIDRFTKA